MKKTYWCATLLALFTTLCSFECSKQSEDIVARQQVATTNITVDYRSFPAHSVYTIINEQTGSRYVFDSDSLKYFNHPIDEGTYQTQWRILGITEDKQARAKMLNDNQGTLADWKVSTIIINGHNLRGSFVFSKVPR